MPIVNFSANELILLNALLNHQEDKLPPTFCIEHKDTLLKKVEKAVLKEVRG